MRAIFVADLECPSASGRQRLWALEECGVEVVTVNKEHYPAPLGRWSGHVARLLRRPRLTRDAVRMERELADRCQRVQPDIVWLEWPREIRPSALREIRERAPRALLISFQDDNPWGNRHGDRWIWRDYLKLVPEFDLHLVKRPSDIENLSARGAMRCRLWEHGVYRPLFHPPTERVENRYPVSFVGTCMDGRAELIGHLLKQGLQVHIFGTHWEQRSDLPGRFPAHFHPAVRGEAYAEVIRHSQVCLGIVSHSNCDEWTMRTFEVPGCAGVLLAQRTPTHDRLFAEGSEAAFFSTAEECAAKLRVLLNDPGLCRKIGEAANRKCLENGWTLEARMQQLIEELGESFRGQTDAAIIEKSLR